jgi:hypothetical protein
VVQQVIEQGAKIGLDDVELALSHGRHLRKVVGNLWALRSDYSRCAFEIAVNS